MPSMSKVGKSHTKISTDTNGVTRIKLYDTVVVEFSKFGVTLNSGDFRTATTKNRMNQAAHQYHLGYDVYQVKGVWWVRSHAETAEFYDGMVIPR